MSRFNLFLILSSVLLLAFSSAQEAPSSDLTIDANSSQHEITIQPGDTLWDIALRYETTVEELKLANNLVNNKLRVGASLKLPDGSNSAPETYIVQEGDTLFDIALAFSLTVDDLIAFNNIDGSFIKPGQKLVLNSPKVAPAALIVKVVSGDTLWSISRKYDIEVVDLIAANKLASDKLSIGTELIVPGRYAALETNAGTSPDLGGAATTVSIEVAKGDTLWEIAKRYDTDISALMSANNLSSTNIKAGQVLRLVSGGELTRAKNENPQPILASAAPAVELKSVSKTLSLIPMMIWPLKGVITSKFGFRRLRIANSNYHTGLDIDGITGDPIKAAVAGTVSFAGRKGGYGKLVIIKGADDRLYYYAHASELLVNKGDEVVLGQVIAKVGNTGRSTGSHLHFEIRENGQAIDPLTMLEQNAMNP